MVQSLEQGPLSHWLCCLNFWYHQYIHWVWLFNQFCIPLSNSVVQYTLCHPFSGNSLKVLSNALLQRFSWFQCQVDSSEATRVLLFLLFEDSNICPFPVLWYYCIFHVSPFLSEMTERSSVMTSTRSLKSYGYNFSALWNVIDIEYSG